MLDYLIAGGMLVDGTGAAARRADVGIQGERIVAVGALDEVSRCRIDAEGLLVTPGFVDPHTHYDAQLHWDAYATPSSNHGVTSVIGGNCGFTLAPLRADDADYARRMLAQVEGMPLAALEQGMTVDWESFGDFLDGLEGATALNAGFLVGHCALRRYVMGPESQEREARPAELDALRELLHQSLAAGGLGLSTTRSPTHPDHQGNPVASRLAAEDEVLALCDVVGQHPGTTLEAIVAGCLNGFDAAEIELLAQMSARANRPLNWNVLTVAASDRAGAQHQLLPGARARELGGRVVALTMPTFADNNMSFATYCALWLIPGWRAVLSLPDEDKTARLRDPAVRAELVAAAAGTVFQRFADFGRYRIGDTVAAQNRPYEGRVVADIAREQGVEAGECLTEILVADRFATVLWPLPGADSDADWALRRDLWAHPDVLLGGSDAGAHLDRMLGSSYPTRFLADTLRGRRLLSVEQAVHLMTAAPARLFGLRDRGQLSPGAFGDVVLVDPETVDSGPATRVHDLPGHSLRLTARSSGIERVFVNGVPTIENGEPTGATAGRVLRSGRDTDTVTTQRR